MAPQNVRPHALEVAEFALGQPCPSVRPNVPVHVVLDLAFVQAEGAAQGVCVVLTEMPAKVFQIQGVVVA